MKAYHYHSESFVLVGCSDADESPLEEGVFLIPAHATDVVPPDIPDGAYAKFVDGVWVIEHISPPADQSEPELMPEDIVANHNAEIKRAIATLEFSQGRAIREAVLTGDLTRLKSIDDQIADLRAQFL